MAEIHADGGPIPHIPDDLTIPQFILNTHHVARPALNKIQPWLVEELTVDGDGGRDEARVVDDDKSGEDRSQRCDGAPFSYRK